MGAIFTATILAISEFETLPDIAQLPPQALVSGINMTYGIGGNFIIIIAVIAIMLIWHDRKRRNY
jgi:hypothetical protein